mmetsp:Transcript_17905/g.26561  ORF Transcript_17905/g.26561 Transcript_17905/m.26561 type:complete len:82 (-) Transcript_17905:100-345(-)
MPLGSAIEYVWMQHGHNTFVFVSSKNDLSNLWAKEDRRQCRLTFLLLICRGCCSMKSVGDGGVLVDGWSDAGRLLRSRVVV